MIIVSQDKETIINFDKVIAISTSEGKIGVSGNLRDVDFCLIGEYQTEERAKEVLKEIIQLFTEEEMFHINKSSLNNLDEFGEPKYILRPVSRNKVFYMPKE